jgi:hypothetical protein
LGHAFGLRRSRRKNEALPRSDDGLPLARALLDARLKRSLQPNWLLVLLDDFGESLVRLAQPFARLVAAYTGGAVMRAFNRENWEAANERLVYFLRALADEGYPDELIADVTMASGVVLIDEVYGRDALVRHLARLALTAADRKADMSIAPKFLQ